MPLNLMNCSNRKMHNNGVATPDYSALTSNTDWIDAVTRTGKFNNDNISISQARIKTSSILGWDIFMMKG